VVVFPNAKINLGLRVVARRTDGFHNIETVFVPVGLCDALEAIASPDGTFHFDQTGLTIPGDPSDNLCIRACRFLQPLILEKTERTSLSDLPPVRIHLHKVIPMGAGLGGGSSDGTWMLKLLNELFSLELSADQLREFANKLGSDCAFFIDNKPVVAFEKGDHFLPLEQPLPDLEVALVFPGIHCDTAEAYRSIVPHQPLIPLPTLIQQPVDTWRKTVFNDFENPVFNLHPKIARLKEQLYQAGAIYASLTGSGSAVYGLFDELPDIQTLFPEYQTWCSK
jgi:4-diphosphocytidyl-2-C-methyl-D-erythritol kinase